MDGLVLTLTKDKILFPQFSKIQPWKERQDLSLSAHKGLRGAVEMTNAFA